MMASVNEAGRLSLVSGLLLSSILCCVAAHENDLLFFVTNNLNYSQLYTWSDDVTNGATNGPEVYATIEG